MSKKAAYEERPEQFLTRFLNTVPDVPECEELRKARIERYQAIDDLQFQTAYLQELVQFIAQTQELVLALNSLAEAISAGNAVLEEARTAAKARRNVH